MRSVDDKITKLLELLEEDSKCLILTHDNPDPDSISSAVALRHFLKSEKKISSQIASGGLVGRSENQAMLNYLNIKLLQISEINWSDYKYIALVDTQPYTGNNSLPHNVKAHIVIDHHPLKKVTRTSMYFDVRDKIGATATILSEYLFKRNIAINVQLATSLFYGIKSETQDLGRESSKKDLKMYTSLFPLTNKKRLSTIENSRVSPFYFKELNKMLSNIYLVGDVITSDLGIVEHSDIISEMADFMLRLQEMNWSICIGQFENNIYISVRTIDEKKDSGKIMSRLLKNIGSGGGHGMTAGGKIPLVTDDPKNVLKIKNTFLRGFFRQINREFTNPKKLLESDTNHEKNNN